MRGRRVIILGMLGSALSAFAACTLDGEPSDSAAQAATCAESPTCSTCGPSPMLADLMFAATPPAWAPPELVAAVFGSATPEAGPRLAADESAKITEDASLSSAIEWAWPANERGGSLLPLDAVTVLPTGTGKWEKKSPIPLTDPAMIFFRQQLQQYCPVGAMPRSETPRVNCQDHAASATACMGQLTVQHEGSTTTSPMQAYFVGAYCSCNIDGSIEKTTHAGVIGCFPSADGKQRICGAVEPAWLKGDDAAKPACGFYAPTDGKTPTIHRDCEGFFCANIKGGACSVEKLSIIAGSDLKLEKYAPSLFGPNQCPTCARTFREQTKKITGVEMDPSTMAPIKPGPVIIKKPATK